MSGQPITLIGGGLVGALLAVQLAQRGFSVDVHEKRPDPRRAGFLGGRSINLALAERGLQALRMAGLAETVLQHAVMMRGRMVHDREGNGALQRYGVDDSEVIWSVSRGALNMLLLDAAEAAGARLHFGQALASVDFDSMRIRLATAGGGEQDVQAGLLIGADGAGSALRSAMNAHAPLVSRARSRRTGPTRNWRSRPPGSCPPPCSSPAAAATNTRWSRTRCTSGRAAATCASRCRTPRAALPSPCSCPRRAPHPVSPPCPMPPRRRHSSVRSSRAACRCCRTSARTTTATRSARCPRSTSIRWHLDGRALLIGDAAHAIVPFHGQGMNCGFEDTVVLADLLAASPDDTAAVFAEFQRQRQPNADAIAAMAVENYVEMRDSVADPHYLAKRELGSALAARIPDHCMARYRLV
ncbi:FAD-dependent oxidoreductase, partial [Rhodanobacter lindaniclasticus]